MLKVEARLVEVGVVVRDNHGHILCGFTKDDFAIEDSGKKQVISASGSFGGHPGLAHLEGRPGVSPSRAGDVAPGGGNKKNSSDMTGLAYN